MSCSAVNARQGEVVAKLKPARFHLARIAGRAILRRHGRGPGGGIATSTHLLQSLYKRPHTRGRQGNRATVRWATWCLASLPRRRTIVREPAQSGASRLAIGEMRTAQGRSFNTGDRSALPLVAAARGSPRAFLFSGGIARGVGPFLLQVLVGTSPAYSEERLQQDIYVGET